MWWILAGFAVVGVYTFVWCLCQSAASGDKCRIQSVNPGETTAERRKELKDRYERELKRRAQMRVH